MKKIKVQEALKLKKFPNKVLVYGEEEYLTRELIKKISKARTVEKFFPESLEEFFSFSGSSLFGGETTPVILYGEELPGKLKKKAERQAFLKKLSELPSFVVAVFKKLQWKELSSGFFKEVAALSDVVVESEPYSEKQIYAILSKKFKREGRELPPELIKLIVEIVGTDLTKLKHETDKLIAYPGQLTEEVIRELLFSGGNPEPFSLIYPLVGGDARKFVRELERLFKAGIEPLQLIGLLQSQLRSLVEIACGRKPRLPKEIYESYRVLAGKRGLTELLKLLKALHQAEFSVKIGGNPKEELIKISLRRE